MQSKTHTTRPDWLFIISALALSVIGWYGFNQTNGYTMLLVCTALLFFGLPHGAFDLVLMRNFFMNKNIILISSFYLLIAILSGVIWYLYPSLFLIGFILISMFHFGDSDWPNDMKLLKFSWGALVISLPAFFHQQEVTQLFSWLVPAKDASTFAAVLYWITVPFACIFVWMGRRNLTQLYSLVLLLPIYLFLHPLLSFTFYFTIFHARRHLNYWHQRLLNATEHKGIIFISVLITSIVVGYGALAARPSMMMMDQSIFVATIITLACLTVPHMIMIYFAHRLSSRSMSRD